MERRMGKFKRKFALPDNANTDQITTVEKLPKAIELRMGPVDRISLLPDELLVLVLSLLSFKEATATSLLSRRWRYLHAFTTKLDFDCSEVIRKLVWNWSSKRIDEAMGKFLIWVDDAVRLNRSSRLEKFRVVFHLSESDTLRIDNWVRFAFSRKVESLELLSPWLQGRDEHYTLNLHKCSYDFNFIRKLSTHWVKVSGEAVEMLLRNCPLLEQLSIAYSEQLLGLKIIKPFPTFRSLEILMCSNLTSIVVDDANIMSVKYFGHRINKVVLVNVPLLTEIWIHGTISELEEDVADMFSSVLPQLHTFKLGFSSMSNLGIAYFCLRFGEFVKMSNLKQLVVDITNILDDQDLIPLIGLMKASPRLQRFVIEEAYEEDRVVEAKPFGIPIASSASMVYLKAYTEFKEVVFVGYRGVSNHFWLLKHLVENAIALETIVVDPWGFRKMSCILSFDRIPRREYNDKVFARANALKHLVPFGINVKIL